MIRFQLLDDFEKGIYYPNWDNSEWYLLTNQQKLFVSFQKSD